MGAFELDEDGFEFPDPQMGAGVSLAVGQEGGEGMGGL